VNESGLLNFSERVQRWDGVDDRYGALLASDFGLQKTVLNLADGLIQITLYAEAGAKFGTLKGTSALRAAGGIEWSATLPKLPGVSSPLVRGKHELSETLHPGGQLKEFKNDVSVGNQDGRIGMELHQSEGDLPNFTRYNTTNVNTGLNDSMGHIYLQIGFEPPNLLKQP